MTEREVFSYPYPSSVVGFVMMSAIYIVGGYVVSQRLFWPGAVLILAGVGVIVLSCVAETRYTITCTPDGFTVGVKRRLSRTRHTAYAWHDVCETSYREIIQHIYFAVYTNHGRAFEVRWSATSPHFVRGKFDAMIDVFNAETPHLPYTWQWRGPGSTRFWRYGFDRYHKVPRETVTEAHLPSVPGGSRTDEQRQLDPRFKS